MRVHVARATLRALKLGAGTNSCSSGRDWKKWKVSIIQSKSYKSLPDHIAVFSILARKSKITSSNICVVGHGHRILLVIFWAKLRGTWSNFRGTWSNFRGTWSTFRGTWTNFSRRFIKLAWSCIILSRDLIKLSRHLIKLARPLIKLWRHLIKLPRRLIKLWRPLIKTQRSKQSRAEWTGQNNDYSYGTNGKGKGERYVDNSRQ